MSNVSPHEEASSLSLGLAHGLKVWGFMLITLVPLSLVGYYLPRWLFVLVFFGYGLFVLMPVVFGIGPIGRRIARELNATAIAQAKVKRDALGPRLADPPGEVQTGPGGERAE
jgi:hypothetical protein